MQDDLKSGNGKREKICFFGHFGSANFGNEATLQAMLHHVHWILPKANVACICTRPEVLAATQDIEAIPISRKVAKGSNLRTPWSRLLRRVFVGLPNEGRRWLDAFRTLKDTAMLLIPGTGLLTDAYGLRDWGPYNLFKWTLVAKLRRCKVLFVSVGAGPIYSVLGRCLVKSALALADFRSYRDQPSLECARKLGLGENNDPIYPDLVFSLPAAMIPRADYEAGKRPVVGIGLMAYAGKYSTETPSDEIFRNYLTSLAAFVVWLLANGYDTRLLIGD